MKVLRQNFQIAFSYNIFFSEGIFNCDNSLIADIISGNRAHLPVKVLFVLDSGVYSSFLSLKKQILQYCHCFQERMDMVAPPHLLPGGENCKNNPQILESLLKEIEQHKLCRHSYIIAIGGGAVLDTAGFAASIAHRGIRLIRVPTTVLAQNDSGIGVKTGVNAFNKKNFLGSFATPYAVINSIDFLTTLTDRVWRSGIAEAIKVALIKDKDFFYKITESVEKLKSRDLITIQDQIFHCARLHLQHIKENDPFEKGSSRPLDYGHWSAHKLEQLTNFKLLHGEAVAIGMAIDCTYSMLLGKLKRSEWEQVIQLLTDLGFNLKLNFHQYDFSINSILKGLDEFREHLGGQLTIMILEKIGHGTEVKSIDLKLMQEAILIVTSIKKDFYTSGGLP